MKTIVSFILVLCFTVPVFGQIYEEQEGQEGIPDAEKVVIETKTVERFINLKQFKEQLDTNQNMLLGHIIEYNDFIDLLNTIIDALSLSVPHRKYAKVTLVDERPVNQ